MSIEAITTGFEGIYEVSEAARYLSIDMRRTRRQQQLLSRRLLRWVHLGLSHPALSEIPGRRLVITFEDLVSMRVIAFLRSLNYSFHKIRRAEALIREATQHPRPFATDDIWAEKERTADIFSEMASGLLVATRHGQMAFRQLMEENLTRVHGLTFNEGGIANSWTPWPDILFEPRIQFGRPCIAGTRIPTSDLVGMVDAGDSIDVLAKSYGIKPDQIQGAITWERELAAT